MITLGRFNTLRIVRSLPQGLYLDGQEYGDILLPGADVTDVMAKGQSLSVFIYRDSEDRMIATTRTPLACVGDFAALKVKAISPIGTFLEWGLQKDLLLPKSEQLGQLSQGGMAIVYLYVDEKSDRIVATMRVRKFLQGASEADFKEGQAVQLKVYRQTPRGFSCVVDNRYCGSLYANECFVPVKTGSELSAFVKKVRDDGTLDCILSESGHRAIDADSLRIYEALQRNGGFLAITDKSSPEDIAQSFGLSKKAFKRALGGLYKQRKVVLSEDGIRMIES
jgi:predicted RNA-binding protein (virulence factor B family)